MNNVYTFTMGVKKLNYHINPASWYSVFAVPCELVDKHLKLAGAVQLKVLLWALRHNDQPINDEAIATALHIQRADVSDAMLYWQECGLLIEQNEDEYIPTAPTSHLTAAPAESPAVPAAAPPKPPVKLLSRPQKADNAFVARRMLESDEIRFLMEEAQQILGRLINNGESATLLMLHDDYGLPVDVIIMLIQYAVGIGKGNLRYIEKVALAWADKGIQTGPTRKFLHTSRLKRNCACWTSVSRPGILWSRRFLLKGVRLHKGKLNMRTAG